MISSLSKPETDFPYSSTPCPLSGRTWVPQNLVIARRGKPYSQTASYVQPTDHARLVSGTLEGRYHFVDQEFRQSRFRDQDIIHAPVRGDENDDLRLTDQAQHPFKICARIDASNQLGNSIQATTRQVIIDRQSHDRLLLILARQTFRFLPNLSVRSVPCLGFGGNQQTLRPCIRQC